MFMTYVSNTLIGGCCLYNQYSNNRYNFYDIEVDELNPQFKRMYVSRSLNKFYNSSRLLNKLRDVNVYKTYNSKYFVQTCRKDMVFKLYINIL